MADTNETKKDYSEFQRLLKKGIGLRTQSEFAEQAGITKAHLNRMLNSATPSKPTKAMLMKIAKHLFGISYEELLAACGYEVASLEENIKSVEDAVADFFKDSCGKAILKSVKDVCDEMEMLYFPACACDDIKFHIAKEEAFSDEQTPCADFSVNISVIWKSHSKTCYTGFALYYTKTSSGYIIPVKFDKLNTVAKTKAELSADHAAAERLLKNIFGPQYPITYVGFGLKYDGTPNTFQTFLMKHAASFCTTKERSALYREAIREDADFDKIFEKFEDDGGATGTGAVIAVILSEEMKDVNGPDGEPLNSFLYFEPSENVDENEAEGFVMQRQAWDDDSRASQDALIRLYEYAKELGSEKFGLCHYRNMVYGEQNFTYETDKFEVRFTD